MTRPIKPTELNWITPYLVVSDVQKAVEFYTTIFGFEIHQTISTPSGWMVFARIRYNGSNIILSPQGNLEGLHPGKPPIETGTIPPIAIYVYCDNIEQRYKKAVDYGLTILLPLRVPFWGDRTFRVVDPEGYIWDFGTNVADVDPAKLPEEFKK